MDKSNNNIIAKRYADSLIELGKNKEASFDEISNSLDSTKSILQNSSELFQVLTNPIISANDKEEIIEAVFKQDTIECVKNFLKLLISKNRFDIIYRIIEKYQEKLDEIKNIANVNVTCAVELKKNKKDEIISKLEEKLKKKIKINYEINDSIIAGLVYKIEDDVIDTSLNYKLEEFKKEIIK